MVKTDTMKKKFRIIEETKSYEQRLIEQIINNLIKGNFKMLQRSCKHYYLCNRCELICEISNVKYRVFFEDYTDHLKIYEIEDIDNINLDKSYLVFKGVFFNHEAELFYDKIYGIQFRFLGLKGSSLGAKQNFLR